MSLEYLAERLLYKHIDKKIPWINPGEKIPRAIYQISPSQQALPPPLELNSRWIQRLNPHWRYQLFDQGKIENFLLAQFPQIKKYYDLISDDYLAAKSDLFRYILLYHSGGVYLDLKSGMTKPLDETLDLDSGFILSHWTEWHSDPKYKAWGLHPHIKNLPEGEFQQWHIICSPGHPYLRAVIVTVITRLIIYMKNRHGAGSKGILQVTGPIPYTQAIQRIQKLHKHKLVPARELLGLEYNNLGNMDHRKLFPGRHYSQCDTSLIVSGRGRALVDGAYAAIKVVLFKK